MIRTILFTLFLSIHAVGSASDFDKEKRWADQVVDSIMDGDALYLDADDHQFLSIYTASSDESTRAMIVVHGTGIHPNWQQVVQPMRVEMSLRGWNTLAIQMPILENEATYEQYVPLYPDVPPRLKAAQEYLKSQGNDEIVVVAHSQGATMSAYYLSRNESDVAAFVAIGMGATQKDDHINSAQSLSKISIPVLDIYGSDDLESVLSTRELRADSASHNEHYSQMVIDGADHFFEDNIDDLLDAVHSWLDDRA